MLPFALQLDTLESQGKPSDGQAAVGGTGYLNADLPYMTADEVLPKEFRKGSKPDHGKMSELAVWLHQTYMAGNAVKNEILSRINKNEELYRNRPRKAVSRSPYKGAANHHIPVVGPRLQQRKEALLGTIGGADKMFYLKKLGDTQRADNVESDLEFLLEASNFRETLADIVDTNMPANQCALLIEFTEDGNGATWANHIGPYAGFKFEVIHPQNFVVYPASHPDIARAAFAAHEFERRRAEVIAQQKTKAWFEMPIIQSVQSLRTERGLANLQVDDTQGDLRDRPVKIVDALIRYAASDEEPEKVYRVIFEGLTGIPYRIEPYEKPFSRYVTYRFYKDLTAYWAEDSPANDGQSLNMAVNDLFNTVLHGIAYASRRAVLAKGVKQQDSLKRIEPGSIIPVTNLGETEQIESNMQLSGIDFVIQILLSLTDGALRVPDTITGQQTNQKDETATEQNIKFSGFQLMGAADIKSITPALRQTAMMCLWLMYENWEIIHAVYGENGLQTKLEERDMLRQPGLSIAIAGQEPTAAPGVQQQQIQTLLQMFGAIEELHPLILPLILKFVNQTSIEGKEEITVVIEEMLKIMQMTPEELTQQAAEQGIVPPGAGGANVPGQASGEPGVPVAPEGTPPAPV